MLHGIVTVHLDKQTVRAALHRQMQMLADLRLAAMVSMSLKLASFGWLVMKRMW